MFVTDTCVVGCGGGWPGAGDVSRLSCNYCQAPAWLQQHCHESVRWTLTVRWLSSGDNPRTSACSALSAQRGAVHRGAVPNDFMTTMIESHPLQFPWTFTFFKKAANKGYEENTSTLGTTESVRPPLRFPWPRLALCQPRARLIPRLRPPHPPPPSLLPGRGLLASLRPPAEASR